MTEAQHDPEADTLEPPPGSSVPRSRVGASDPMLGAVINEKYRVVDVIATGGMGRIYRAEQLPLGRMVAVKVILPNLADPNPFDPSSDHEGIRLRFLREASVLAQLQHPNIVTVFDYGRIDAPKGDRERFVMAMELLEGETLQARLERDGRLCQAEALEFLVQMARGLRAAHARGIVHRDLKPSNLMIVHGHENDHTVKLLDFGVTKVIGEKSQDLTDEGIIVGSPRFMSPEQAGGVVDVRSDIYSFGIIAHTMLTGRPPFMCETAMLTMMEHLNTPLPSLVYSRPELGVSEWLDEIIQQCCEKHQEDRYQSAQGLLDALRRADEATSGKMADAASPGSVTLPDTPVRIERRTRGDEPTAAAVAPAQAPRLRLPVVFGALALVSAAAFFVPRLTPLAVPSPLPAPIARAATSRISVTSTPTDVEVYGDGNLLGRTPLTTTLPAGATKTHLELRLAGYALYARDIEPRTDLDIVAVLAPDAPPPTPSATPAAPSPTVPPLPRHDTSTSRAAVTTTPPSPPATSPPAPPPSERAPSPPATSKPDPFEDRQ